MQLLARQYLRPHYKAALVSIEDFKQYTQVVVCAALFTGNGRKRGSRFGWYLGQTVYAKVKPPPMAFLQSFVRVRKLYHL